MSNIYLVVKERGEYSDWIKENVAYCLSETDAKNYIKYAEECQAIKDWDRHESYAFSIETIPFGRIPENAKEIINNLREEKAKEVKQTREERKNARQQQVKAAEEKAAKEAAELQTEVNDFLDWWTAGPTADPFFNQKRPAMLRSMKTLLPKYIEKTGDIRAVNWMTAFGGVD